MRVASPVALVCNADPALQAGRLVLSTSLDALPPELTGLFWKRSHLTFLAFWAGLELTVLSMHRGTDSDALIPGHTALACSATLALAPGQTGGALWALPTEKAFRTTLQFLHLAWASAPVLAQEPWNAMVLRTGKKGRALLSFRTHTFQHAQTHPGLAPHRAQRAAGIPLFTLQVCLACAVPTDMHPPCRVEITRQRRRTVRVCLTGLQVAQLGPEFLIRKNGNDTPFLDACLECPMSGGIEQPCEGQR
jgi:hypothetical protein